MLVPFIRSESRLYLRRTLRSFEVQSALLRSFCSVVASVIYDGVSCWGSILASHTLKKKKNKSLKFSLIYWLTSTEIVPTPSKENYKKKSTHTTGSSEILAYLSLLQTTSELRVMNLQNYPTAPVLPAPSTVQYTTVNVIAEPPRDHIIWSIFSLVYSNPFCLGLAALIFSVKARDRKMAGDVEGARHYGSTARCLNISAMIITSLMVLITIITVVISVQRVAYYNGNYNYKGNTRYNWYG
ncbi:uncharacterized protein LOC125015114 [Mugil cephalus]|uniref:uncharacterized protein LOC125015114 n=1 Tax=Mugil cephalus TaxID=48193 RepID=UPI001FB80FA5|nr:uncharacterized protein LOC125015114 [Mugil cephalus]